MEPRVWVGVAMGLGTALGVAAMGLNTPDTGAPASAPAAVLAAPRAAATPAEAPPAAPAPAPTETDAPDAAAKPTMVADPIAALPGEPVDLLTPRVPAMPDEAVRMLDGGVLPADVRGLSMLFRARQPETDACFASTGYGADDVPTSRRLHVKVALTTGEDGAARVSGLSAFEDAERWQPFLDCALGAVKDTAMEAQSSKTAEMNWNIKLPR